MYNSGPLLPLVAQLRLAMTYSPTFDSSTISATGLNFSVRNG